MATPWPTHNDLDELKSLEPSGSFECRSGILLWGHLENVMEAKLNLQDEKYDGIDQTWKDRDLDHHFKCRYVYLSKVCFLPDKVTTFTSCDAGL